MQFANYADTSYIRSSSHPTSGLLAASGVSSNLARRTVRLSLARDRVSAGTKLCITTSYIAVLTLYSSIDNNWNRPISCTIVHICCDQVSKSAHSCQPWNCEWNRIARGNLALTLPSQLRSALSRITASRWVISSDIASVNRALVVSPDSCSHVNLINR